MDQIVNGLRDILQYVIGLAGLVAVGFILYGGFKYMSSRDDPRAVAGARTTLINATIGLVLAVMAFPLTNWVIDRVAPDAARVSDTVLENVVVQHVGFGKKDEWDPADTTANDGTRTVLVRFSAPVCVEGQGSNLKLRTNRGNMNLLTAAVSDCEAAISAQKSDILFQIKRPGETTTGGWLAALTVSGFQKSGNVAIVSPSGAPVIETIPTTYTCTWPTKTGEKIGTAGKTQVGDSC